MRGLPGPLPEGERVLWQDGPQTRPFLRQIFRTHLVITYVGLLLGWCLVDGAASGNLAGAAHAALQFGALAAGALLLMAAMAHTMARKTTYTITTARVLIEYGAAFEKTLQIPFVCLDAASVRTHDDGTADIVLTLAEGHKVNYFIMWPHVRPWHIFRAQPALRAVPEGAAVAQILGRAMAAQAGTSPVALVDAQAGEREGAVAAAA